MSQDNQEQDNQPSVEIDQDELDARARSEEVADKLADEIIVDQTAAEPFNANRIQKNHKGWSECVQKPIIARARQMNMPEGFSLGNGDDMTTGKPGDYLFINYAGEKWIVTEEEFNLSFDLISEDSEDAPPPAKKAGKSIPDDAIRIQLHTSLDRAMDNIIAELSFIKNRSKQKKDHPGLDEDVYIIVTPSGRYDHKQQAEFTRMLANNRLTPNNLFYVAETRVANS